MAKVTKKKKAKKVTKKRLTPQEELFCQYYVNNRDLFSDATHSYAAAYGYKLDELPTDDEVYETDPEHPHIQKLVLRSSFKRAESACAAAGGRLIRSVKINTRITELLNEFLTDKEVDAELAWVIKQRDKLDSKIAAVREYNALRTRIQKKIDITTNGKSLFNDETKTKTKTLLTRYIAETPGSGE